jgi:hypothetical protein
MILLILYFWFLYVLVENFNFNNSNNLLLADNYSYRFKKRQILSNNEFLGEMLIAIAVFFYFIIYQLLFFQNYNNLNNCFNLKIEFKLNFYIDMSYYRNFDIKFFFLKISNLVKNFYFKEIKNIFNNLIVNIYQLFMIENYYIYQTSYDFRVNKFSFSEGEALRSYLREFEEGNFFLEEILNSYKHLEEWEKKGFSSKKAYLYSCLEEWEKKGFSSKEAYIEEKEFYEKLKQLNSNLEEWEKGGFSSKEAYIEEKEFYEKLKYFDFLHAKEQEPNFYHTIHSILLILFYFY